MEMHGKANAREMRLSFQAICPEIERHEGKADAERDDGSRSNATSVTGIFLYPSLDPGTRAVDLRTTTSTGARTALSVSCR